MSRRIAGLSDNNYNTNQVTDEQPTQTNQTPANQQSDPPEDYVVQPGDTLTKLASRRGILIRDILRDNPQVINPNRIFAGQHLRLPVDAQSVSYTVRRGDSLSGIARRHETTVGNIHRANRGQIGNSDLIYPGQRLRIPTRQGTTQTTGQNPAQTTQTPGTNQTQQPPQTEQTTPNQTPQNQPMTQPPATQTPTNGQTPQVTPRGELRLGVNEEYREALLLAQRRTGIDAAALAGVIDAEAAKDRRTGRWLPNSQASTSSARGLTQFTDDTWIAQARVRGSYLNEAALQRGFIRPRNNSFEIVNRTALLALRDDPTLSIVSAAEHGRDNLARLERNGFLPANLSDDEKAKYMYYAHHEGYGGAIRHLTDSRTADENTARRVLEGNSRVVSRYMNTTVADLVRRHNGSYREAYREFAEFEARRIFPAQVGRTANGNRIINQYVQRHGSYEQGYRAWLNDYTDSRIQPSRYREVGNGQTPTQPPTTPPQNQTPTQTGTTPNSSVQQTGNDTAPPNGELSPHLRLKHPNIRMSPLVRQRMSQIADEYHRLTGKNLTITDGDRTPSEQADRMFSRFRGGNFGGYRNRPLLNEVIAAYREGERRGESPTQIRDRMAQTIQNQVNRGDHISRHLVGQGADVRISDMSASDRAAFLRAVATVGGATKLNEGNHWHIQVDPNAQ